MAFDFPTAPTIGQLYPPTVTGGVAQYVWNGSAWIAVGSAENYVKKSGDVMSGALTIKPGALPSLILDRLTSAAAVIYGKRSGVDRWQLQLGNATAESSGNAGSDFAIYRFDDTGAMLGGVPAMSINRANSNVAFSGGVTAAGLAATGKFQADANALGFLSRLTTTIITADSGASIGSAVYSGSLQIQCTAAQQSYMTFHVAGVFAANFGMDSLGNFYCGGQSLGAAAYRFYTSRDGSMVTNGRLVYVGDWGHGAGAPMIEPFGASAVVTGCANAMGEGYVSLRYRQMQLYANGTWFAVGSA